MGHLYVYKISMMHTGKTKTEQNFVKFNTNMQKFMRKYGHLSSGEIDKIGHTAMNHPVFKDSKHLAIPTRQRDKML